MKRIIFTLISSYIAILLIFYLTSDQDKKAVESAGSISNSPKVAGSNNNLLGSESDKYSETGNGSPINTLNRTPTSIPLEQAAYYHLPEDQRSPGNLGGPPPLPAPGSDPSNGHRLQLPATPGTLPQQTSETTKESTPPVLPAAQ